MASAPTPDLTTSLRGDFVGYSQISCFKWGGGGRGEGCIGREGASEAAPRVVRQVVGGGCQSGCGRLLSVTNAIAA